MELTPAFQNEVVDFWSVPFPMTTLPYGSMYTSWLVGGMVPVLTATASWRGRIMVAFCFWCLCGRMGWWDREDLRLLARIALGFLGKTNEGREEGWTLLKVHSGGRIRKLETAKRNEYMPTARQRD